MTAPTLPLDVLAAEITGLCRDGVAIVVAASGASADTLINVHGTIDRSTLKKGEGGGNKSISYLDFAGIDLRITPDGETYCFEVNPSPAYSAFEEATGQPISLALARYLAGVGPV